MSIHNILKTFCFMLFASTVSFAKGESLEESLTFPQDIIPAKEMWLLDKVKVWLHTSNSGKTLVTLHGKPLPAGVYMSKDVNYTFAVDENGFILTPLTGEEK